jgi:hypothetical protein
MTVLRCLLYIPSVNLIHDPLGLGRASCLNEDDLVNPCDKMVLKTTLDQLMEDIRSYQLRDECIGKVIGE